MFFCGGIFVFGGWAALCGIAVLAFIILLYFFRNDAMCCISRDAKIVTQKTTEVWRAEQPKRQGLFLKTPLYQTITLFSKKSGFWVVGGYAHDHHLVLKSSVNDQSLCSLLLLDKSTFST